MKKGPIRLLCIISFLSLLVFARAAETRTVKVGAFDDYPLIFMDSDKTAKGLYVDLLSEIGKKENIEFQYVFGTWQDGLDRIKSGEVNLLTDVAWTEERSAYMDYGKNSLLTFWGELYTLESSDIKGILDITGKKIGALKGDIFNKNFQDLLVKFSVTCRMVEFDSYEDVFRAIGEKKIDAGVAAGSFKRNEQKKYGVKSTGFVFSPLDVFFTAPKGTETELLFLLDTYLILWKHQDNSAFDQARQKWLYNSGSASVGIPPWLKNTLLAAAVLIALAFIFIVLLNLQVRMMTRKIRQREKAQRESEKILKEIVDTIPLAIHLTKGLAQVSEYINPTMEKLFGYSIEDIPNVAQWWPLAYPDAAYRDQIAQEWTARVRRAIETQSPIEPMETIVTCKDGMKKNISWGYVTMGEKNYSFGLDLTERKAAEDKIRTLLAEKELTLQEVHHRIKNNMTTIKGLLSLQISGEENASVLSSLEAAERRVQSLIVLYDRLYCTDNYRELSLKDYLQPLAEEVVHSFSSSTKVKIVTEIDDCVMNAQQLTPIGIIVNELLGNIMKYSFGDSENAIIHVSAFAKNSGVRIEVSLNCISFPENSIVGKNADFGMQLVGKLLEQLRGTMRIERGNGTSFILEIEGS